MAGLALVFAAAVWLEIGGPEKISQFGDLPLLRRKQCTGLETAETHRKRAQLGSARYSSIPL